MAKKMMVPMKAAVKPAAKMPAMAPQKAAAKAIPFLPPVPGAKAAPAKAMPFTKKKGK